MKIWWKSFRNMSVLGGYVYDTENVINDNEEMPFK